MSKMEKIVCVTGAAGYVASWLVKLLLQRDYMVRATVRNLGDSNKVEHLKALEGAKERLQLFEANLLEEGAFDSIIDGCDGVFHTASPVLLSAVTDPQAELIEPAVKGTLNVLQSCTRASSVRRVVVTSSIASVLINENPKGPDTIVDETWFSDPELCKQSKLWYWQAKTLAEEAAVKFAKENGIDLVVMNPGFVVGSMLQPSLNTSSNLFLNLIKGNEVLPVYQFVDVRDVACAHIMAFENPSANGRYLLVESSITHYQALQILNKLYPSLNLPNINDGGNSNFQVSKKKAESLGLTFIPLELWYWQAKTLAEEAAVRFAKENGINLVVMNPGFVVGPMLQPSLNTSSDLFLNLIKGPTQALRKGTAERSCRSSHVEWIIG